MDGDWGGDTEDRRHESVSVSGMDLLTNVRYVSKNVLRILPSTVPSRSFLHTVDGREMDRICEW